MRAGLVGTIFLLLATACSCRQRVQDEWWRFDDPKQPKCARVTFDRTGDGKPDPGSEFTNCDPPSTP